MKKLGLFLASLIGLLIMIYGRYDRIEPVLDMAVEQFASGSTLPKE